MNRAKSKTAGAKGGTRLPFDRSERKKVIVLVILVGIGAIIVVGQLWSKNGPAAAQAASPTAAAPRVDLEALIKQMRQGAPLPVGAAKPVLRNVDEALEVFVEGAKAPPVALGEATRPIFGVPAEFLRPAAPPESEKPANPPAAASPASKPPAEDPALAEMKKLTVETVLMSARNQAVVINGQVLHRGDAIGGFRVVEISRTALTLEREDKKYELPLN